jgi:hypothetical protein
MKLNSIKTLFFCLFISLNALSQRIESKYPVVSVVNTDSVIIFSIEQGKKIAIINEDRKRLQKLSAINENEISQRDSIIRMQYNQIENFDKIKRKYDVIVLEKDDMKKLNDSQSFLLNKEIKKQTRHKWIAIISGVVGVATISYFYITK